MTEEIINSDGSRNWQANILLNNIKRLEQENKELKEVREQLKKWNDENLKRQDDMQLWIDLAEEQRRKYRSALEEIKNDLKEVCKEECDYTKPKFCGDCDCRYGQILNKINEVLMSVTGYFESILRTWKEIKHTPTAIRDMKIVLGQFDTSVRYNEIEPDKLEYLKKEFKQIYNGVYNK